MVNKKAEYEITNDIAFALSVTWLFWPLAKHLWAATASFQGCLTMAEQYSVVFITSKEYENNVVALAEE